MSVLFHITITKHFSQQCSKIIKKDFFSLLARNVKIGKDFKNEIVVDSPSNCCLKLTEFSSLVFLAIPFRFSETDNRN